MECELSMKSFTINCMLEYSGKPVLSKFCSTYVFTIDKKFNLFENDKKNYKTAKI